MTHQETVVSRVTSYGAVTAAGLVLPFLTLPIMTRWLTPEDYGIVALAQVAATIFVGLSSCEIRLGFERNYFKYEKDRHELAALVHTTLSIIIGGAVVAALAVFGVRRLVSALLFQNEEAGGFVIATCLSSSIGLAMTVLLLRLRNAGRAREYMWHSLAAAASESVLALVFVTQFGAGVWGLVLGGLVAKGALVGALWGRLSRELPMRLSRGIARELIAFGAPMVPRTGFVAAESGADRLLIGRLVSLGHVGLFGMGNRIGASVFTVMTTLEQIFTPSVYRMMFEGGMDASRRIGRYVTPYLYASVSAAAIVVLFVDEVLWLLVTPAFYGASPVAVVLAVYYGQLFFSKIAGLQFAFRSLTWYATPLAMLRAAVHVTSAIVLIPHFGATGAALGLLATGLIVDSVVLVLAQRAYRISYELSVVIPIMAVLYVAAVWVLGTDLIGASYAIRLCGKVIILGVIALLGRPWFPTVRAVVFRWRPGVARADEIGERQTFDATRSRHGGARGAPQPARSGEGEAPRLGGRPRGAECPATEQRADRARL